MARFLKQSLPKLALKKRIMVNCINSIIEMSPRFVLGRENVPCVAEVVNRSLKADCTDFSRVGFDSESKDCAKCVRVRAGPPLLGSMAGS